MKKIYLLVTGIALGMGAIAQQNITSVSDGNATNPFTWDCTCIPTPDDNITINNNVVMNSDWAVTAGGSITINDGASFIQDNNYRSILFDGGGATFTNYGVSELTNFSFTNGAEGHNHSDLSLDTALYVGAGSMFMNHGLTQNVDSTLIQGMFMNEGTYSNGDFLNEGGMVNNTGYLTVDSLYNSQQGVINSSAGNITANDFGTIGTVNITGSSYMIINNDVLNGGILNIATGRDLRIGSDLLNTSDGDTAVIINNGLIEIGNDFSTLDTIRGTGVFCITNASSNIGDVLGSLDICDNSGMGIFDINTGNVDATVTDCNSGCNVGVQEDEAIEISIYPNPVSSVLNIEGIEEGKVIISDVMGKEIYSSPLTPNIDVNNFKTGVYFITISYQGKQQMMKFIKR